LDARLASFLEEPFVRAAILGLGSVGGLAPSPSRLRLYWASRELFLHDRDAWNVLLAEHVLRYLVPAHSLPHHTPRELAAARGKLLRVLATAPARIVLEDE
jgi:hypothetical protein